MKKLAMSAALIAIIAGQSAKADQLDALSKDLCDAAFKSFADIYKEKVLPARHRYDDEIAEAAKDLKPAVDQLNKIRAENPAGLADLKSQLDLYNYAATSIPPKQELADAAAKRVGLSVNRLLAGKPVIRELGQYFCDENDRYPEPERTRYHDWQLSGKECRRTVTTTVDSGHMLIPDKDVDTVQTKEALVRITSAEIFQDGGIGAINRNGIEDTTPLFKIGTTDANSQLKGPASNPASGIHNNDAWPLMNIPVDRLLNPAPITVRELVALKFQNKTDQRGYQNLYSSDKALLAKAEAQRAARIKDNRRYESYSYPKGDSLISLYPAPPTQSEFVASYPELPPACRKSTAHDYWTDAAVTEARAKSLDSLVEVALSGNSSNPSVAAK